MANYYYGYVRLYTTPAKVTTLTTNDMKTPAKTNPIPCYDNYKVWYVVDVYKTTVSNFSQWAAAKPLSGTLVAGSNKRLTINKNSSNVDIITGDIVNSNSHFMFSIYKDINTGNTQVTCTPSLSLTQSEETGSDVVITNILWENTAKTPPTIAFSQKAGDPTFPTTNIDAWRKTKFGTNYKTASSIKDRFFYTCNNLWYLLVNETSVGTVSVWKFDKDGLNPSQAVTPRAITNNAQLQSWNQQNAKILQTAKDDKTCSKNDGTNSVVADIPDVNPTPPTDYMRWNPPPHSASRSVPYGIKTKGLLDKNGNVINGDFSDILIAGNYNANYAVNTDKGYSYLERGRIFQDKISASIMNTTKLSIPAGSATAKQWGFRFMYNPTTISYNTAANNSIDWTRGSKDSAALLSGNQTVTFQLYLNRLVDMGYLDALYGSGVGQSRYDQMTPTMAYGRNLEEEEYQGILHRGTEYDIEFLYRTLTGDPLTNNPLFNPNYKGRSADIGYITGIPLWLYLNDNLRYYGAVASLGVNHVIFNTEMVPMLSVVDISFARYPAQFGNNSDSVKSIVSTLNTPAGG